MQFVSNSPNEFGVVPVDVQSSGVMLSTSVFLKASPIKRSAHRKLSKASDYCSVQQTKTSSKYRENVPNSVEMLRTSRVFTSIPAPTSNTYISVTVAVPEAEDDEKETVLLRALRTQEDPSVKHVFRKANAIDDQRFLREIFNNSYLRDTKIKTKLSKATLERLCSPKHIPGSRPGSSATSSISSRHGSSSDNSKALSHPGSCPGTNSTAANHPHPWMGGGMCYFPKPPPSSSSSSNKDVARRRHPTITGPGSDTVPVAPASRKNDGKQPLAFMAPPLVDRYIDFSSHVTATNIIPLEEMSLPNSFVPIAPADVVSGKKVSPRSRRPPPTLKKDDAPTRPTRPPLSGSATTITIPRSLHMIARNEVTTEPKSRLEGEQESETLEQEQEPSVANSDAMMACVESISESMVSAALANALQNILIFASISDSVSLSAPVLTVVESKPLIVREVEVEVHEAGLFTSPEFSVDASASVDDGSIPAIPD